MEEGGNRSCGDQYRKGYQNRGEQLGPARDPNTMEMDRGKKEDRMCFVYGKWGYMAKNCWQRIVGKEKKEREKQQRYHKSQQKTMEDSELLAGLLKYIQCIVSRETGK